MSHTKTAPAPGRPGRAGRTCCRLEAPPRRTLAGGARRASVAGSEEPEIASGVDRRRDPVPVAAGRRDRCGLGGPEVARTRNRGP